ncbi:hypothetical protein DIPPA_10329 [Diplonema papillatum]|nr:hypothetical protein DIPPA_10329 [Diplonema papillatum]
MTVGSWDQSALSPPPPAFTPAAANGSSPRTKGGGGGGAVFSGPAAAKSYLQETLQKDEARQASVSGRQGSGGGGPRSGDPEHGKAETMSVRQVASVSKRTAAFAERTDRTESHGKPASTEAASLFLGYVKLCHAERRAIAKWWQLEHEGGGSSRDRAEAAEAVRAAESGRVRSEEALSGFLERLPAAAPSPRGGGLAASELQRQLADSERRREAAETNLLQSLEYDSTSLQAALRESEKKREAAEYQLEHVMKQLSSTTKSNSIVAVLEEALRNADSQRLDALARVRDLEANMESRTESPSSHRDTGELRRVIFEQRKAMAELASRAQTPAGDSSSLLPSYGHVKNLSSPTRKEEEWQRRVHAEQAKARMLERRVSSLERLLEGTLEKVERATSENAKLANEKISNLKTRVRELEGGTARATPADSPRQATPPRSDPTASPRGTSPWGGGPSPAVGSAVLEQRVQRLESDLTVASKSISALRRKLAGREADLAKAAKREKKLKTTISARRLAAAAAAAPARQTPDATLPATPRTGELTPRVSRQPSRQRNVSASSRSVTPTNSVRRTLSGGQLKKASRATYGRTSSLGPSTSGRRDEEYFSADTGPYLGLEVADSLHLPKDGGGGELRYDGVRVVSARHPAAPAVLNTDVILRVNNVATPDLYAFKSIVRSLDPTAAAFFTVRRRGAGATTFIKTVEFKPRRVQPADFVGKPAGTNYVYLRETGVRNAASGHGEVFTSEISPTRDVGRGRASPPSGYADAFSHRHPADGFFERTTSSPPVTRI